MVNKAIYICAATMALASCSNDEVVEQAKQNAISFRSVVGMNTRATEVNTEWLQQNDKLYVTTFKEDGDRLYDETPYFYDGSVWMARPGQSWGGNEKLSFVLTSPKLDEFAAGYKLEREISETYVTVDEEIPDQKDFLVARLGGVSKTDGSVPVSLKHMFSSVEVRAKNTNGAFKYKVKGIRLCGVNRKGQVSFYAAEAMCNGLLDTRTYEMTYDTPVTLNGDAQSLMGTAGNAILPPQAPLNESYKNIAQKWQLESPADAKSTYISVLINLTSKYGASVYPAGSTADNETYGWVAIPVPYEWESGKKYVYTLDFSDGAGRVDPNKPGDAVDAGGKDPAKAEPVLGTRIVFGITVSPWNNENHDTTLSDGFKYSVGVDSWRDEEYDATIN